MNYSLDVVSIQRFTTSYILYPDSRLGQIHKFQRLPSAILAL